MSGRYYITTRPKINYGTVVWTWKITFFDEFDRVEKEVNSHRFYEDESSAYDDAKEIADTYVEALKVARTEEFKYEPKS